MKKKIISNNDKKPNAGIGGIGRTEIDFDDLVHSDENEKTTEQKEYDPDDAVHRAQRSGSSQIYQPGANMEDLDDLVHGCHEDDEE